MVDTALSVIPTIVNLGIKIYDAFETKKENSEECKHLIVHIESIRDQLDYLKKVTRDQEKSLEQELCTLKDRLKECEKFIDQFGKKWLLTKLVFNQGQNDELKTLNVHLDSCQKQLHYKMTLIFEDYRQKDTQKIINTQHMQSAAIQEIHHDVKRLLADQRPCTPTSTREQINIIDQVKNKYKTNSGIKRTVNEEKSFPIEQSYINLAIVETKEQHEKEKKLKEQDQKAKEPETKEQHEKEKKLKEQDQKAKEPEKQQDFSLEKQHDEILRTYEEIYGVKTSIDVENIFQQCKDQIKKVFVLGRAGIGKSTFCQYVTYRWAKGEIWSEYELVILIRLRRLTDSRYPPSKKYSVNHLLENEYFPCDELSHAQIKHFKQLCNKGQVLWILDGYDEFAQNIPEQLKDVFDHVRETQHHILTSRPYAIKSSYDVKLEITGFTNDNIVKYVDQFFDQTMKEINTDSFEAQKLLRLLKSNSSIWGVAHIPVNLELICSLWSNNDWTETTVLTMTVLYDNIIEWQCRRYLANKNINHEDLTKSAVYDKCNTELQFLEYLSFKGMECNKIMLTPAFLIEAKDDLKSFAIDIPQILKMGILKSYDDKAIGTQNQTEKQHYFVHLSFQEHFAARNLLRILKSTDRVKAINFINSNKYNQRFHFVFVFASGLLAQSHYKSCIEPFWSTVQSEPIDLVGVKHIKLLIACVDEFIGQTTAPQSTPLLQSISKWLAFCASHNATPINKHLIQSLQQTNRILNTTIIQKTFLQLLDTEDPNEERTVYLFIAELPITEPIPKLQSKILAALYDMGLNARATASTIIGNFGEKAATNGVIAALLNAIRDEKHYVRQEACSALGNLREKAATNEVIAALVNAMSDYVYRVRWRACEALGNLREKAATNEVIAALLSAMRDEESYVREEACEALGKLGEKAVTNEVIAALINATRVEEYSVRRKAWEALGKLGEKGVTNEMIAGLVNELAGRIDYGHDTFLDKCLVRAMCSFDGMKQLNSGIVKKLCSYIRNCTMIDLTVIPSEHMIKVFFDSGNASWLGLVVYIALSQGIAVTVEGSCIWIYDGRGPFECNGDRPELLASLIEAFRNQKSEIESG
ncbi:unnamed protein product [Rotaria socialis]|uniref:NACHT domain-containing protein n=1 Tax=Rotaria socialis TaxID=392032 RepID=A0A820SRQ1_9BILA|nr:unnamed protein product [Rotaria socialis]CAF4457615.1 unnamed protein product [Rotaria socialis]